MGSILLLLSIVQLTTAVFNYGACPEPEVVQNFNASAYMGLWYEAARVEGMPFEHGDCDRAHYTLNRNGTILVVNSEVEDDGKWKTAVGDAYCASNGSAYCHVRFSSLSPYADYKVLTTDYSSHAVIFTCTNFYAFHLSFGWFLEREKGTLNYKDYMKYFEPLGITEKDIHVTEQKDCPPFNGFELI